MFIPVAFVVSLVFISQGSPMTLKSSYQVSTLEPAAMGTTDKGEIKKQTIVVGPVAAFESIKMLGTNGGGFYGMNSAHPYENPTGLSNFFNTLSMMLFPFALVLMYGRMLGRFRHGLVIFSVMLTLMAATIAWSVYFDTLHPNPGISGQKMARKYEIPNAKAPGGKQTVSIPAVPSLPVDQHLGNLEGKEMRFGTSAGATFDALTMAGYLGLKEPLKSLGTDVPTLIALLVCLIPTTIGALLAAIGIAGMDRALQANIIAKSGKAVELAGDVDVVLLDKTGTITVGNRHATLFIPAKFISVEQVGRLAALASAADATPEGKSILKLYENESKSQIEIPEGAKFIPFTAQTRMSGVDLSNGKKIRKGAPDAIVKFVGGKELSADFRRIVEDIASKGATPLAVAEDNKIVGLVALKDILKPHISERYVSVKKTPSLQWG